MKQKPEIKGKKIAKASPATASKPIKKVAKVPTPKIVGKAAQKVAPSSQKSGGGAKPKSVPKYVVKPKRAMSSWLFFNTETVVKLKAKENLDHKEAFARSAEIWKGLDEKGKAPFEKKSKQDEERFRKQTKELEEKGFFTNTDGSKSTDNMDQIDPKKRFGKDVMLPKKPMSAYLCYTQQNMNTIKEKNKCTHPEAMKLAGELWSKMNDKDKKKYEDSNAKDQQRYNKQLAELNKKGFFMMDDGSKSNEHLKKTKKPKKGSK